MPGLLSRLQPSLAGVSEIERELVEGGMAVVSLTTSNTTAQSPSYGAGLAAARDNWEE